MRRLPIGTLIALVASTCSPPTEDHHFMNEGMLCVFPTPEDHQQSPPLNRDPRTFEADRPLHLSVTFPVCMSARGRRDVVRLLQRQQAEE
jgi:hypothetical protein